MMRLSLTHADLSRKLTQSLVKDDEVFLAETETGIRKLAQPLDKFRIRSQQRVGADDDGDGALRCEENSVGELVARAEEQLRLFERDVAALWKEWAVAEGEVQELLQGGVVPPVSAPALGQRSGNDGEGYGGDEEEEILRRFRQAVEKQLAEAEEEVVEIGEEAVAMMKDVEKVSL
jgi:hypothetical protein